MLITLIKCTMKKTLLFGLLFSALGVSAQTTHMVNWGIGEPSAQFSKTINSGDSVMWMWTTSHPHNVTSNVGSAETFSSGNLTGVGNTYTKLFTTVGTNPYRCTIHAGSMFGTITVQAVAGTNENVKAIDFSFYPNPVEDELTINAPQVIDRIQIFDMNGKVVMDAPAGNPTAKIYMNNYTAGTYLVKVTAGAATKSFNVVKK